MINIYTSIHTYIHTLHYITLYHITLHYITSHHITLHDITFHYTHTYINTYIHTYIHAYIHTYMILVWLYIIHYICVIKNVYTWCYVYIYICIYNINVYIYFSWEWINTWQRFARRQASWKDLMGISRPVPPSVVTSMGWKSMALFQWEHHREMLRKSTRNGENDRTSTGKS